MDTAAKLHDRWLHFVNKETNKKELGREYWNFILRSYSEKNRHYHNLDHIFAMLSQLDITTSNETIKSKLEWAIWFHDIVYQSRRKDNEKASAEIAQKILTALEVEASLAEEVYQLILYTADHMDPSIPESEEIDLLLDLDLMILGSDIDIYCTYAKAVRKEYGWVPALLYKKGRRKVLESMLQSEKIYRTQTFFESFEQKARENMKAELKGECKKS